MTSSSVGLEAVAASAATGEDIIHDALVAIRNHLGMEVAYFSEFSQGRTIFRRVDAPGFDLPPRGGPSSKLVQGRPLLYG